MKKFILAIGVALLATSAGAATIPSAYDALFDGYTEVTDTPGSRVDVEVRIEADSGEVVHAVRTNVLGDGIPAECHDIRNFEGEQDKDVRVDHKLPNVTGDYDFEIEVFTAPTMQAANALKGDLACAGTPDTSEAYQDVIHVVPGNGGSSSSNDDGDGLVASLLARIDALLARIADLEDRLAGGGTTTLPVPTQPSYCTNPILTTTTSFSTSWEVSLLQDVLVQSGFMTNTQVATGPGIYGPRTTAAHNMARTMCG